MNKLWEIVAVNLVVLLLMCIPSLGEKSDFMLLTSLGVTVLVVINLLFAIFEKKDKEAYLLSALIVLVVGFSLCLVPFK